MKAYVCDSVMGSGKTCAAINKMRTEPGPFIFVTKFLSEVDRICRECAGKHFAQPKPSENGKLGSLLKLLQQKRNIASTHALFYRYNDEVLEAIRAGGYTLILDEVVDTVGLLEVSARDVTMLMNDGCLSVGENNRATWIDDGYEGNFEYLSKEVKTKYVTLENDQLLVWTLPSDLFAPFKEVWVLTYMFESSLQCAYFKLLGIDWEYMQVQREGSVYKFLPGKADNIVCLPPIHIEESRTINRIGHENYSLSSTWFRKHESAKSKSMVMLKNNIYNVFRNRFPGRYSDRLWTTYEQARLQLRGRGYSKGFLSYNARAVNDYSDRFALAYCVNVFMNPFIKRYFTSRGVEINEDQWALSEMLQWVWRSAVRRGEEIWLYIPSRRMRLLFLDWVREVTSDEGSVAENVR